MPSLNLSQVSVNIPKSLSGFIHPVNLKESPTKTIHWTSVIKGMFCCLSNWLLFNGRQDHPQYFFLLRYILIPPVDESLSDAICSAKIWAPYYCDVSSPGDRPPTRTSRCVGGMQRQRDFTEAFDGPLQNLTLPSYPAQNRTGSVGKL